MDTALVVRIEDLDLFPWIRCSVGPMSFDPNKPLAIVIQDFSTSQTHSRDHVPAASAALKESLTKGLGGQAQLLQLGVHTEVFPFVPEVIGIEKMRVITREDLRHKEHGGLLKAGSALSNAFIVGAKIALNLRERGFTQPIMLAVICDGYNNQPGQELSEGFARLVLQTLRTSNVGILLAGYVPRQYAGRMAGFVRALELQVAEISISYEVGGAAVTEAFGNVGRRTTDRLTERLPPTGT